ncbi:MAG: SRPBCC family protein [Pseudoxanthomonas sp.]
MNASYATVVAPHTVRIERTLPGPIERVWAFLTESDKRRQWLAAGDMELKEGGSVEHVFRNSELTGHDGSPPPKYAAHAGESRMRGRITACKLHTLLAYDWGEGEGATPSHVRFELTPRGDEVQLVVVHSRLPDREQMLSVAGGWHTHLGILVDRLEGREPPGFWETHSRLEAEYETLIP